MMGCEATACRAATAQVAHVATDLAHPAVQKQDDKDEGRAGDSEGQVREDTVPPNVRVMETMLRHLDEHYGGIMGYLHHIGLTAAEACSSPSITAAIFYWCCLARHSSSASCVLLGLSALYRWSASFHLQ